MTGGLLPSKNTPSVISHRRVKSQDLLLSNVDKSNKIIEENPNSQVSVSYFIALKLDICSLPEAYLGGVPGLLPSADKCTKLSWCKGDIRINDNLRTT